jgi:hypothetical protein
MVRYYILLCPFFVCRPENVSVRKTRFSRDKHLGTESVLVILCTQIQHGSPRLTAIDHDFTSRALQASYLMTCSQILLRKWRRGPLACAQGVLPSCDTQNWSACRWSAAPEVRSPRSRFKSTCSVPKCLSP